MPINILMPALSPTMTEGNLARWLKKEGDAVKSGDVIAEIETDKATIEVPSSVAGRVTEIKVKPGDKVQVGAIILTVDEDGAGAAKAEAREADSAAPKAVPDRGTPTPQATEAEPAEEPRVNGQMGRGEGSIVR